MTALPRGGVQRIYMVVCGFCGRRGDEHESRKAAKDAAWAAGWKLSLAYGLLCLDCHQRRGTAWERKA